MEGLLIAEELRRLEPLLPSRRLGWRFPDPFTFVLPISSGGIWIFNRPPSPRLEYREQIPPPGRSHSGFQDLLTSRATGDLLDARQAKLDRLVRFEFAAAEGFVETAPVSLVAELTGRNCNLILLDEDGSVLGAAREVHSDVNRFREVVAGRKYVPPPPYEKLDPRKTDREALRDALRGKPLRDWRAIVDGVGPQLVRSLSASTGLPERRELADEGLERALDAFARLVEEPSKTVRESLELPDVATLQARERRQSLIDRLRGELDRELELVEKRLGDLERARAAASEAAALRRQGDLLLTFPDRVPSGSNSVTLPDFSGGSVQVEIEPGLGAAANAQRFYQRARKREARAQQADLREPELQVRREELTDLLQSLPELDDRALEELSEKLVPAGKERRRSVPGVRYQGPHGFTVVVGRNSRENDQVTFKIARSRDVWLHVQGYHGAHVVILAENREVPFDTILFAARLAAGYSKASESENVPVDYTLRKNVWKVKGQSAGAVNFTRHKTVYVTPSRKPVEKE